MKFIHDFTLKSLLCLFLCFISTTKIYGQSSDFQHQKDSLLKVIASTKGEEKLKTYKKLTSTAMHFPEEETDLKLQYINDFIREARKQQNKKYEDIACKDELACLWNSLMFDKFEQKANKYLPFFKENGFQESYYGFYRCLLVKRLTNDKNYKYATEGIQQMCAEAKKENCLYGIIQATSLLADIYLLQEKRYEDAEKYYRETIENALKLIKKEPSFANYDLVSGGYDGLAQSLLEQDKMNECLSLMSVWKKHTVEFEKTFGYSDQNLRYYYRCCAKIYIDKGEYNKADLYCDSLNSIITPMEFYFIWDIKIAICVGRKEYDRAIDWIDEKIDFSINCGELSYTVHLLKKKALCLNEIGHMAEAFSVFNRAFELNDSIRQLENNAQLDEIRTQYEVDKHIAEKERQRVTIFYLISGLTLTLIALGIWIYSNWRIIQKNRILAQQIKELTAQQGEKINEILDRASFVSETETSADNDLCIESRMDKLCVAVRDFLLKDKSYRDPDITQEYVIKTLGTNRRVFSEAMKHCLKMQFSDYVNFLRLKDAVHLLEQSDLSLEEISIIAGFGTAQTFRNQFYSKYNMNPKDYRKSIKTSETTVETVFGIS